MDSDGVEISRMRTGRISNPELGGAQELVGFPVEVLIGFCGKFRDWWVSLFRN